MNTKDIRQIRLVEALTEFGGTARAFADGVFAPENFISQCKLGRRPVPDDLARRIEAFMEWPPFQMDTPPDKNYPVSETGAYDVKHKARAYSINGEPVSFPRKYAVSKVPVFSSDQVSQWRTLVDNFIAEGTGESLFAPQGNSQRSFAFKVGDDSMTSQSPGSRSYPKGVFVFIDPDKDYGNNNAVLALLGARQTPVLRLLIDDGITQQLVPINRELYKPIDVTDMEYKIIGVVTGTFTPEI